MQEHISLELAKEIASKYLALGVEAPKSSKIYFEYDIGEWDVFDYEQIASQELTEKNHFHLYTAAEIFKILPVGTKVETWNCSDGVMFYLVETPGGDGISDENLSEALGLMWLRVLDEMVREKGKGGE